MFSWFHCRSLAHPIDVFISVAVNESTAAMKKDESPAKQATVCAASAALLELSEPAPESESCKTMVVAEGSVASLKIADVRGNFVADDDMISIKSEPEEDDIVEQMSHTTNTGTEPASTGTIPGATPVATPGATSGDTPTIPCHLQLSLGEGNKLQLSLVPGTPAAVAQGAALTPTAPAALRGVPMVSTAQQVAPVVLPQVLQAPQAKPSSGVPQITLQTALNAKGQGSLPKYKPSDACTTRLVEKPVIKRVQVCSVMSQPQSGNKTPTVGNRQGLVQVTDPSGEKNDTLILGNGTKAKIIGKRTILLLNHHLVKGSSESLLKTPLVDGNSSNVSAVKTPTGSDGKSSETPTARGPTGKPANDVAQQQQQQQQQQQCAVSPVNITPQSKGTYTYVNPLRAASVVAPEAAYDTDIHTPYVRKQTAPVSATRPTARRLDNQVLNHMACGKVKVEAVATSNDLSGPSERQCDTCTGTIEEKIYTGEYKVIVHYVASKNPAL